MLLEGESVGRCGDGGNIRNGPVMGWCFLSEVSDRTQTALPPRTPLEARNALHLHHL